MSAGTVTLVSLPRYALVFPPEAMVTVPSLFLVYIHCPSELVYAVPAAVLLTAVRGKAVTAITNVSIMLSNFLLFFIITLLNSEYNTSMIL